MLKQLKFEWRYRYVNGGLEPDQHGRWALDCYINVSKDTLPETHQWLRKAFKKSKYHPIRVAIMQQKGCAGASVPSLVDRFCVTIPSFEGGPNTGMSNQHNFFGNDIEELKKKVESQFNLTCNSFTFAETIKKEIEGCPFCGCKPKISTLHNNIPIGDNYWKITVQCEAKRCKVRPFFVSKLKTRSTFGDQKSRMRLRKSMIEVWNKRK